MAKFRKKPVIIEATQWFKNGDHPLDKVGEVIPDPFYTDKTYKRLEGALVRFFRRPDVSGSARCRHCSELMHDHGWIDTKEGGHIVCPADWIITGVEGEHYPCKPSIFYASYDTTEPPTSPPPES